MRAESATVVARNAVVVERIRELKADHPFWGYRRVWATLRFTDKLLITQKRVRRLMQKHGLLVAATTTLRALRTPTRSKPRPTEPDQWYGIDMTKVMTASGWSYVVIVLDWFDKKIVGHYAGEQAKASHWLVALDQAMNRQFPQGVEGHTLHLMSDNGSQPTSVVFMKVCGQLGIEQAFTSYNNPKGNADTERMMRTLKEELFWLREWTSPTQVAEALDAWVAWYNENYRHSALGYKTPNEFKLEWKDSLKTQLQAA
jgi:transposase InsO family protein